MKRHFYSAGLAIILTFILAPFAAEVNAQQRPQGKANTAKPNNTVPKDWTYVFDKVKGFGFYTPKGTTGGLQTMGSVEVTILRTPSGLDIFVLAYKDKTKTKEDLLNDAVEFMHGLELTVTPGELTGESDNYAVANTETENAKGGKGKQRILVGTDVTDNYIMIVGAEPKIFDAHEEEVDLIWGSFEMWSGKS